jgi:hypothetical protein
MLTKVSSKSPTLNAVAAEVALDLAVRDYTLSVVAHIPGVANVEADALSRLSAPEPKAFPRSLRGVPEHVAPPRGAVFWRAAGPPRR